MDVDAVEQWTRDPRPVPLDLERCAPESVAEISEVSAWTSPRRLFVMSVSEPHVLPHLPTPKSL